MKWRLFKCTAALQRWIVQTDNTLELETLQRDLHTSKVVRAWLESKILNLAHELECFIRRP